MFLISAGLLLSIYLGRQCRNWKWLPLVTDIMGCHPNRQMITRLTHLHDPPKLSPRECSKNIPVTTVTVSKSNLASLSFVYKTLPVLFHAHHHYSFNILQFHICSQGYRLLRHFLFPHLQYRLQISTTPAILLHQILSSCSDGEGNYKQHPLFLSSSRIIPKQYRYHQPLFNRTIVLPTLFLVSKSAFCQR